MNDLTRNILEELKCLKIAMNFITLLKKVDVIEDSIDITTHEFSLNQLRRLRDKKNVRRNIVHIYRNIIDLKELVIMV